jgi:selenide,water dikinase
MGAGALSQLLEKMKHTLSDNVPEDLLVGLGQGDDALVWRISSDSALIATLDFFTPVVDDPYQYGAIAAANAMSDVYAMGGRVAVALNIAAFPEDLPPETAAGILQGGWDRSVRQAG